MKRLNPYRTAKYNLPELKKINKAIKYTIQEGGDMKNSANIITSAITILTVVISSYFFVFQTGTQYQEIKNGISQNSKQLSELINLNKDTVKKVATLQRRTDKIEIYQNLNKEKIKKLEEKN